MSVEQGVLKNVKLLSDGQQELVNNYVTANNITYPFEKAIGSDYKLKTLYDEYIKPKFKSKNSKSK